MSQCFLLLRSCLLALALLAGTAARPARAESPLPDYPQGVRPEPADESSLLLAMESGGPTVIQRTVDEPEKGAINWEASYLVDFARNAHGGGAIGGRVMGLAALKAYFDMERLAGWKGFSTFAHLQATHGRPFSALTGDVQIASNIEALANTGKLYELWLQQTACGGKCSVLFGLLDINSEFYLTESSVPFIHSSFGIGAEITQADELGRMISTFPTNSLALRFKAELPQDFYAMAAVFDAVPGRPGHNHGTQLRLDAKTEGAVLIGEGGWQEKDADDKVITKLGIGAWTYSKSFRRLAGASPDDGSETARSYGAYLLAEREIAPGFIGFFRYGRANAAVNRFVDNATAGFLWAGPIPSREEDRLGFGISLARNGADFIDASSEAGTATKKSETAYELFYDLVLSKNVSLQPDLQYIANPGMNPEHRDAVVGMLRAKVVFGP